MSLPLPRRDKAVGLRYRANETSAPQVVAKGQGPVAERIVELAREYGVPVRQDPDLVELLGVSEVGDEVPTEVFGAVARLIHFLWDLNGEALEGAADDAPPSD